MPRGDKPTTVALALKDGWVYEYTLPTSITKEEYDWWFKESLVLDGVRMGPSLTTKPPDRVWVKLLSNGELSAYRTDIRTEHHDGRPVFEYARSPATAAPVVDEHDRTRCASCNHEFCKECYDISECCKCDTAIPPRTVAERLAQHEHIEIVEGVLGGVNPLVSRRRISVHHILSYLYSGESIDYIAENYQLSPEAIKDAIAFAQDVYDDAIDLALRAPAQPSSTSASAAEEEILDVCAEYCSQLPRVKEIAAIIQRHFT